VDVPDQAEVDRFLPPINPRIKLDYGDICAMSQMAPPGVYMEMRRDIQKGFERVPDAFADMEAAFADIFGRGYGAMEAVACDDAETILVLTGTAASTGRQVIDALRAKGEKVGMLKLKMFRPFPAAEIRSVLGGAKKVAVLDRNFSFGASGIFAQEIRAALYNATAHPPVFGYIAGLGGRDVTVDTLETIYRMTREAAVPEAESVWVGLNLDLLG
jgi:pyruvate/2-oxoacid:ferredoxin oxidoreductase alpha subunit